MELYIVILLAGILTMDGIRFWRTHRHANKRDYFKGRLRATQQLVWDLEFKLFKSREVREEVRRDYDSMVQRVLSFEKTIAEWEGDEAERKRVEDQKVLAERERDRFLAQLKMLDREMEGAKPSAEDPEGATGIIQQIDSLREVQGMLRDWIRTL